MGTVSMVVDDYWKKWQPYPFPQPLGPITYLNPELFARKADLDRLRQEVAELRDKLTLALAKDKADGVEGCEREKAEKHDLLRRIAKLVGVDLNDLLKP